MSRRQSLWHVDESHQQILGTVKKTRASRWFVEVDAEGAKENEATDGSGSCEKTVVYETVTPIAATAVPKPATAVCLEVNSTATSVTPSRESGEHLSSGEPDSISDSVNTGQIHKGEDSALVAMESPRSSVSPAVMRASKSGNSLNRRSSQERQRLMQMISDFNVHRGGRLGEIEVREGDEEEFIFDGVLRIYWGVKKPIFISSEKLEDLSPQRRRRSKNITAKDLQSIAGGKRTWSQSGRAARRVRSATSIDDVDDELTASGRTRSLPDASVLAVSDEKQTAATKKTPETKPRRATVGEISSIRSAAERARLSSSAEDSSGSGNSLQLTDSNGSMESRSPQSPRSPRSVPQAIPEESESVSELRPSSRTDLRRASEPAMPDEDSELAQQKRRAKVHRSVSTNVSDARWNGIMERANRRAKRKSYHAGAEEAPKLNVEYFTPPHGSLSNLRTDSTKSTVEVIFDVLRKVNAIDEPSRFALFVVKDSGEVRRLRDDESPLYKRLQLGPKEDLAKLWIMEATETASVSLSAEVAQYYNLSMAFLQKIVERFEEEEERLVSQVRQKFNLEREVIIELLDVMEADVDEPDGDGGSLV